MEKDVLAAENVRLAAEFRVVSDENGVMSFENRGLRAKLDVMMGALQSPVYRSNNQRPGTSIGASRR